jgi:hypothetical protein
MTVETKTAFITLAMARQERSARATGGGQAPAAVGSRGGIELIRQQ